jgi:hypothetical protein
LFSEALAIEHNLVSMLNSFEFLQFDRM